jgi:hypothetical protein
MSDVESTEPITKALIFGFMRDLLWYLLFKHMEDWLNES